MIFQAACQLSLAQIGTMKRLKIIGRKQGSRPGLPCQSYQVLVLWAKAV